MKSAWWLLLAALLLGLVPPRGALERPLEGHPVQVAEAADAKVAPTRASTATTIVLRGLMIFDPVEGAMQGPQDVLIEGSLISAVGGAGAARSPMPAGRDRDRLPRQVCRRGALRLPHPPGPSRQRERR